MRTYQEGLETHRKEIHQLERSSTATLGNEQEMLLSEINRTLLQLREEARQLQSNIALDLNLERKRRADLMGEIESRAKQAAAYLEAREGEIGSSLGMVAKQAMTAIGATATLILGGFLVYKLYA